MTTAGIDGKWRGTYLQDGKPVGFRLTLRAGAFGFLRGVSEEDPVEGIPEPGKIRGRHSGSKVRFRKMIAIKYVKNGGGYTSFNEIYFREHGRLPAKKWPPHPTAEYVGQLSADGTRMTGHWKVVEKRKVTTEGEWSMERMN